MGHFRLLGSRSPADSSLGGVAPTEATEQVLRAKQSEKTSVRLCHQGRGRRQCVAARRVGDRHVAWGRHWIKALLPGAALHTVEGAKCACRGPDETGVFSRRA